MMSRFKVGDKVVPVSKSVCGSSLEHSVVWKYAKQMGQSYLFLNKIEGYTHICDIEVNNGEIRGDFFLESDLIPYEEPKAQIEVKEKPPVYYTLPKESFVPSETNCTVGFDTGSGPDYKGFYEFVMRYAGCLCISCPCSKTFCACQSCDCGETKAIYAEKKFITKEIK